MPTTDPLKTPAFLRLSFRPFFLFGALLALLAVPLWIAGFTGQLGSWQPFGGWLAWHRHEMIFGFASVIVAGFLLTAVQTWTGVSSLKGGRLLFVALVWLAARIAWLCNAPAYIVLTLDMLFLPLVALQMAYCVGKVKQVRNYSIVVVLCILAIFNFFSIWGTIENNYAMQRQTSYGAVWAIATLMGLIGGRVIPFFTKNGLALPKAIPSWPWLDNTIVFASIALALTYACGLANKANAIFGVIFILVGGAHCVRLAVWYRQGIWRVSLLWSLHLAYAWLVIAFIAMGLWHFSLITNESAALHALTVGAMAGLILAMISRVTLGHTGRKLIPPKAMTIAFALFNIGAIFRVFALQIGYINALWIASALWSASFLIFIFYYAPMLLKARVDGRPG